MFVDRIKLRQIIENNEGGCLDERFFGTYDMFEELVVHIGNNHEIKKLIIELRKKHDESKDDNSSDICSNNMTFITCLLEAFNQEIKSIITEEYFDSANGQDRPMIDMYLFNKIMSQF